MNYEVIMFNMSNYSEWVKGVNNRNFQIFQQLKKRKEIKRIVLVDYLPFSLKRGLKNYLKDILFPVFLRKKTIIYKDATTQAEIVQEKDPQIIHFSTIDSLFNSKLVVDKIEGVLKALPDNLNISKKKLKRIVWSFSPINTCFLKLRCDLKVFDAVDNWLFHSSYLKKRKVLEENYQEIAKKSQIIFVLNKHLKKFFLDLGRKKDVFVVSNGVDYQFFQEIKMIFDEEFSSIPRPIIGYSGIIGDRIDFCLVEYLVKNNPYKSFVFIGPIWPIYFRRIRDPFSPVEKLKKYPNVYFLGPKPYQSLPYYLSNFDVGIIPLKVSIFNRYTSSMKLLEYLAIGLPVVSTPTSGIEELISIKKKNSGIIYSAFTYPEFFKMINLALKKEGTQLKQARKKIAQENDWRIKVDEILDIIKQKLT